jgi:signal transduction histidine kinase
VKVAGTRLGAPVRIVSGLLVLGVAAGALAVAAGPGQSTTYAGSSGLAAALTLSAGLGFAVAGLVTTLGGRPARIGDLALISGFLWFAPIWVGWQEGPALVRSLAMALSGFTFPLLVQMLLAYPGGRVVSPAARVLVAAAYIEAVGAATALALFRDPYFDPNCWADCTVNAFLVRSLPSFAHGVVVADRWFLGVGALALIGLCAARLIASSGPARRQVAPLLIPGIAFAATVAARSILLQRIAVEDPFNPSLFADFAAQAVALTLVAVGLIASVVLTQRRRHAVARIVARLEEAPAPGSLQSALARTLGDAKLQIAYWLPARGSYVDANGRGIEEPHPMPGRSVTRLQRQERTVAVVSHTGTPSDLESQIGPAIRLGLENERLQAEVLAQLEDLRASRARIVETADTERRGLERNLHDGAQQHLLALSYNVRLARASAAAAGDTATGATLAGALEETQAALEELRELARGIFPAVLMELGLAPALVSLADAAPIPVEVVAADDRRYPSPVETAAYFAAGEALEDAIGREADRVILTLSNTDGQLVVTVEDDGADRISPMISIADRVGALGGTVALEPRACRVAIPCEPSHGEDPRQRQENLSPRAGSNN